MGEQFNEAWADIKTPGGLTPTDGRQYAVGTIEVRTTQTGALFSDEAAQRATGLPPFLLGLAGRRQVAIIQVTRADGPNPSDFQEILWQRYYYGTSTSPTRATNARAISVWPAASELDTRVAICGETYEVGLPLSQANFLGATTTAPTGFLAVFNGQGDLLWSHHVFGLDSAGCCAITDLSVRVEIRDGVAHDVVTYCGISSHGLVAPGTPLSPVDAFPAPFGGSSGATNQGFGQWDGIVGRVSHVAGGTNTVEFHSIVGGPGQDGLFGIAEFDENRFVVVGGTALAAGVPVPTSGTEFPSSSPLSMPGPYALGVMVTFDASQTEVPGGLLQLGSTSFLGNFGTSETLARDVLVLRDGQAITDGVSSFPPAHKIAVVGSTSDPQVYVSSRAAYQPSATNSVLSGLTDGFVAVLHDANGVLLPQVLGFHGGPWRDGLTGVQGWNEYPDYIVTTGFTDGFEEFGQQDISVESFYVVTDSQPTGPLRSLRKAQFGSADTDQPAAMGLVNATNAATGLQFQTGDLGQVAGGGIAVDHRARVNVVGQTAVAGYPTNGGGRAYDANSDAVRTVLDMVPVLPSPAPPLPLIGRSDGTGQQAFFALPMNFSGGTTPLCALSPFGKLIGAPGPDLPRIMVEYEGPPPAGNLQGAALIVSRPTAPRVAGQTATSIVATAWQFSLPGMPVPPIQLPSGEEYFVTDPGAFVQFAGLGFPDQAFRLPLNPMIPGTVMTAQMICCLLNVGTAVPGGLGPPPCPAGTVTLFPASPAIWIVVP